MGVRDYYGLLGVEPEASSEEIKKAYRRLALAFHPDRNPGDPDSENRLKEINEAYRILGHAEKRRQYDALCRQVFSGPTDGREDDLSGGWVEIIRMFTGGPGMRGPGGCPGRGQGKRGCRRRMWTF